MVLVAGPRLDEARREVEELRRLYPSARALTGDTATVAATFEALDGAGVAHVAAHGCFRSDNPLMSSLSLADGPLTVYDLEGLHRAPLVLVLAACDSGRSEARPGDEILGLGAALFALGTRTLVASVVPVPDAATRPVMIAFHEALGAGVGPARALARAQAVTGGRPGEASWAAAAAFVCFGVG